MLFGVPHLAVGIWRLVRDRFFDNSQKMFDRTVEFPRVSFSIKYLESSISVFWFGETVSSFYLVHEFRKTPLGPSNNKT